MTTISPTNLRPPTVHKSNLYLSILAPATLLSAQINGSPGRGGRTVNFDNGTGSATGYGVVSAAVTAGSNANIGTALMVEVTTAYGVEIIRVKSISGNASSGTLTLAEHAVVLADNQAIVIKHFFQIAPVPPAIRSQVFYKDFNITFAASYATQANPVANIGQHFAGFLSAGSLALSLNAGGSYAVASGASISSHLWACVHNGGGTGGISFSSTTSATPTLTITQADTYWLSYTATDSNGKKQTTYRCIFVYDPTGTQPYTDFTISSLNGDWQSGQWRCSLNLTGTITRTVVPDGSLAVVWMQNYFNGVEGYINLWSPYGNNIVYTGYIWSDSDQDDWDAGTGQASFEIISPIAYLDAITDYGTVSLEAKTSPVLWSDYASTLTVGRGVHHLLKWDTTILDCCDVYGLTANTYGVKVLEFTEDTLLQRINGVAYQRGIHAKMVSDRLGRLHLVQDSQMLNTAARAALDTIFTIITDDISGGVNVVRNATDVRAFADMDGFTYSHPTSTPFISMIPGYIESTVSYNLPEFRGTGAATQKQQVLNASGGQTDSNERVGRLLALENITPREVRLDCRGNYIGAFDIVPSAGWYEWGVADNALKRNLPLNGELLICRSVTHQQVMGDSVYSGLLQTVDVALQAEAIGPDGIPGNYPTSYPTKKTIAPSWTPGGGGGGGGCNFGLGSYATFETDGTTTEAIAALSATKFITAYRTFADDFGNACVLDVSGTTVTPGTPVAFDSGGTVGNEAISITALSATKAIVVWRRLGVPRAMVLDISGTVITTNTSVAIDTIYVGGGLGVVALSATKALVVYGLGTGTYTAVLDVSGSTITVNTPVLVSAIVGDNTAVCKISATSAFASFGVTEGNPYGVVLSGITTTVTVGTPTFLDAVAGFTADSWNFAGLLDSTHALVAYEASDVIKAVVATISGTTVTAGTPVTISDNTYTQDELPSVAILSSTRAVVSFSQFEFVGLVPLTVIGTVITPDAVLDIGTTGASASYYSGVAPISSTQLIVSFCDANDSGQGKAVIATCT